MNFKVSRLLIFTITFLYLIHFTSADFSYSIGDDTLKLCRCSDLQDSIKFKNNGAETTQYTITSNLDFVSITPSDFRLPPGQVREVELLISSPCKSSTKILKLRVRSFVQIPSHIPYTSTSPFSTPRSVLACFAAYGSEDRQTLSYQS